MDKADCGVLVARRAKDVQSKALALFAAMVMEFVGREGFGSETGDEEAMIIVTATIEYANQAARDGAVEAGQSYQQATRDDEPGCIAYCFAADPCSPTRVQVYEAWEDGPSLALHLKHDNYFNMRDTLGKFEMVSAESAAHNVSESTTVYDETGVPRTEFFGQ
ncbi:MAG: antibiotic biosynthesis monooxygenase [Pseudomonadaceae bacterium]|nr:antibiotic biosynthesis monooxygenase [Pseudomonadaceae bacterium]